MFRQIAQRCHFLRTFVQPRCQFASRSNKAAGKTLEVTLPEGLDPSALNGIPQEELFKLLKIDPSQLEDGTNITISQNNLMDQSHRPVYDLVDSSYDVNDPTKPPENRSSVNLLRGTKVRHVSSVGSLRIIRRVKSGYTSIFKDGKDVTREIQNILGFSYFDQAVTLVTAKGMRSLNRSHRDADNVTDVLAFAMETPAREGVPVEFGEVADLGEIVISLPYLQAMAAMKLPYLQAFDEQHLTYGGMGTVPTVVSSTSLAQPAFENITNLKELEKMSIDPDNRPFDSVTLDSDILDNLTYPLSPVFGKAVSTFDERLKVGEDSQTFSRGNVETMLYENGDKAVRIAASNVGKYVEYMKKVQFRFPGLPTEESTQVPSDQLAGCVTVGMMNDEQPVIVVHGILHLLGYDHHTKEARDSMQEKTEQVLLELYKREMIPLRAQQVSKFYVLDTVETEAEIREKYGDDAARSSTGAVFDPSMIMSTTSESLKYNAFEESADPFVGFGSGSGVQDIYKDILENEELFTILVDAGVDVLDSEGNVSLEKVALVDWNLVTRDIIATREYDEEEDQFLDTHDKSDVEEEEDVKETVELH